MGKAAENNENNNTAEEVKTPWYKKLFGGIKKRRHVIGAILAFIAGALVTFLGFKAREELCPQYDDWDINYLPPEEGEEEEDDEEDDSEDEEPPTEE
jgi:hypothetical protein